MMKISTSSLMIFFASFLQRSQHKVHQKIFWIYFTLVFPYNTDDMISLCATDMCVISWSHLLLRPEFCSHCLWVEFLNNSGIIWFFWSHSWRKVTMTPLCRAHYHCEQNSGQKSSYPRNFSRILWAADYSYSLQF